MRKILTSRLFRCLICVILVCSLLVLSSPIKAKASITALVSTAPAWVPVAAAAAAIVIALGVMASDDRTSFNTVVNDVVTYLETSTTYVVNGMVAVWGVFGADQITRSYILKDMIQDVWCWLFDSGIFVQGVKYTGNYPDDFQRYYDIASTHAYAFVSCTDGVLGQMAWADTPFVEFPSTDGYYRLWQGENATFSYYFVEQNKYKVGSVGVFAEGAIWFGTASPPPLYADGLTLGKIQAPPETKQLEDTEVYTDYITKIEICPDGRPDYGDDKKEHLPISFPSTDLDDLILDQTQEDAQSGETDLEFDFETSTDPDPGTGEPGTGTDPDSGSSSWTPPSDMGKFTLDLKQYFPFCIPFDLYAFFTCLNAEPVAPVIEWIIPLPGGKTYPFEIDLSAFDSVAQILRRMQLLLFCVGLAFKTRDLIKG